MGQRGTGTFPWTARILDMRRIASEVRSVLVSVAVTRPTNRRVRHVTSHHLMSLFGEWNVGMEVAKPRRTGHRLLAANRCYIVSG